MEAIVMKCLTSLLILTLMTATVVTERLHIENNARALDTENKTKEDCSQDVTGVRRDVRYDYDDPTQPCYTQFFVAGKPPKRLRADNDAAIRYICQPPTPQPPAQQAQQTYYATMFDEDLGIAVFSAYTLTQALFLPQYRDEHPWCRTPGIRFQGSQALYRDVPYERGHLVPAATFSNSQEHYDSTFTYTNAVPQVSTFNRGMWSSFEKKIRTYAETCTAPLGHLPAGKLYLLTGTSFARIQVHQNNVQSNKAQVTMLPIETIIKRNIFVPNSLWTAGCCVRQNGFYHDTESFAVMGNNVPKNHWASLTRQVTVQKLQNILTKDVNASKLNNNIGLGEVELFPGNNQCSHPFNDLGQNL